MIYNEAEIRNRLYVGEDSRWEFKQIEFKGNRPRSPRRNDLADEIASFANGNGGNLLCSVSDDGEVQSMSRDQLVELDSLLGEVSTDAIRPSVRVETHHFRLSSGELVLLVEIPKSDSQHDSPGGSFIRVGSSKRQMTSDERLRLAQRCSQARYLWFDKQPQPKTGFGTLDESLWKPLLSAEGATEPEAGLVKLALLTPDDAGVLRATITGILLCTKSPEHWLPQACITATCYRGRDRASGQVDAREITGPVNVQVADAMSFAIRNMRISAQKSPARSEHPQYSKSALFEALVNAVAHRDYSIRSSKIRLSMFEDRLEIQSPGTLPNDLTLDSIAERQATRNETLTSALGRIPVGEIQGAGGRLFFIERRGDGVPIIRRETEELSGKLPEFRLIDESEIRVVIPAASQEESPAQVSITAWSEGQPVPEADLLILYPNKTWKKSVTNSEGEISINLYTTNIPITVFAAATGYAGYLNRGWTPSEGALAIEMQPLPKGGSVIFPEAKGNLPGLKGILNPIRDPHERTYLYAFNIAVNKGQQQPVHFFPGEEMRLTDANGSEFLVHILDIVGRSVLVEYRTIP